MKKQFLLLIPLISLFSVALAQIPNASFENWSGGDPNNWFTDNSIPILVPITEDNNAHEGSSALRGTVVDAGFGFSFPPILGLGPNGGGVASTAPEAIHGWYIANFDSGDYTIAVAGMKSDTGVVGAGAATFANTAVYKEFIINVYYISGIPNGDTLVIYFLMTFDSTSATNVHVGSYYIIDDLSFGLPTGAGEVNNTSLTALETIFPNPCSDEAQIIYNIRESGKTDLSIYDLSGRKVRTVVNEQQTPGRYKAFANLSGLPAGTYFCRLMNGSATDLRKVLVQR